MDVIRNVERGGGYWARVVMIAVLISAGSSSTSSAQVRHDYGTMPAVQRDSGRDSARGGLFPFLRWIADRVVLSDRNGVTIYNGGYGSDVERDPNIAGRFYLLTDRGPNFEGTEEDAKIFPIPEFTPHIGVFQVQGDSVHKQGVITLKDEEGRPLTGLPNPDGLGATGEMALNVDGKLLGTDSNGIDSEGLAALPDRTFWISDEYGPHLLHVTPNGRTLERINPYSDTNGRRSIPKVFARRWPNRGMEGLTVTPNSEWLVGIMQSTLDNPDKEVRATSRVTRLLFFNVKSGVTRQYVYLQDAPGMSNNEIAAISDTTFFVLERDIAFPDHPTEPSRLKRIYRIDITGATDVSDPENGPNGVIVRGRTLEQMTEEELIDAGIMPVTKSLAFDMLKGIPGFPHDKPEGIVIINDSTIAIVNDDDFGIVADGNGRIREKRLPRTGELDRNILYFVSLPRRAMSDMEIETREIEDLPFRRRGLRGEREMAGDEPWR